MQSDDELSKSLLKIHKQFGHASFDRLLDLLRRCSQNISPRLKLCLETVVKSCDVCSQRTKPCPQPVVSLPLTSKFNEIVSMDLHQLGVKLWFFHIIDLFTRQSAAEIIRSKSAETIIGAFFKCWICVYGVPKVGVFSDNGGEFNNSQFGEMCSISVKTSAGYSPWSNGVAERGNAVFTEIVHKMRSDQNVSWETALAWAIYAKNNLNNVYGFTSHQLVFGESPGNPSVENNNVAGINVLDGASHYVKKHLSCLHAARSAFIQAESSERIKRALSKNTRQTGQLFTSGDNVFYWKDRLWLGPAKVIGQESSVVLIRHGGHL